MDSVTAIEALSALAHPRRLGVFRLLVTAGPAGLAAGEIARRLQIAPNTLSSQLAILARASLIGDRRDGRSIIYRADFSAFARLLGFLAEDCCDGRPEACAPLAAALETARDCGGTRAPRVDP